MLCPGTNPVNQWIWAEGGGKNIWIGYYASTACNRKESYKWVNTCSPKPDKKYSYWGIGQPDKKNQCYVELWTVVKGKWDNSKPNEYIYCGCETSPFSDAPTTKPSTARPSTVAPTTARPSTVAPTTASPSTVAPTTARPSTVAPTTARPSTVAPTTASPSTVAPTTASPSTVAPSTASPSTVAPTTASPSTVSPTTASPITVALTTASPLTVALTTARPSTVAPTTASPSTVAPTTAVPSTLIPTVVELPECPDGWTLHCNCEWTSGPEKNNIDYGAVSVDTKAKVSSNDADIIAYNQFIMGIFVGAIGSLSMIAVLYLLYTRSEKEINHRSEYIPINDRESR